MGGRVGKEIRANELHCLHQLQLIVCCCGNGDGVGVGAVRPVVIVCTLGDICGYIGLVNRRSGDAHRHGSNGHANDNAEVVVGDVGREVITMADSSASNAFVLKRK